MRVVADKKRSEKAIGTFLQYKKCTLLNATQRDFYII